MSVHGVSTSLGIVNWNWKNGKMEVTVHGSRPKVRTGLAFGPTAAVEVNMSARAPNPTSWVL